MAIFACICFVIGLRDARLHVVPTPRAAAPAPLTGAERTATLQVRLHDARGAAVSGATVQIFWARERRYYWVAAELSDAGGRARFSALPSGVVWVIADAPGKTRATSSLVLGREARELDLELTRASELEVHVRDERGAPIEHATVLVTTADPLPFGALSDARGVAHVARLGPAPWLVQVSALGFETASRSGVRERVEIQLRRLSSIEVSVQGAGGAAAPRASVMIAGAELWPARSTAADEHGVARIINLLPGRYDLRAVSGSLVSETQIGFELARGAHEHVTLRLVPGRNVTALVTDGSGQNAAGVAGADVVLAEQGLNSFPLRARAGADGRVTLGPIAPGPATLGARAEGFVSSALVAVPEVLDGPVRVALVRGATLRGEVVDSRGFGVGGASIEVVGSDASGLPIADTPELIRFRRSHFAWSLSGPTPLIPEGELGVMPGPVPPIPRAGADLPDPGFDQPLAEIAPWVSEASGAFVAAPVSAGRVRAIVRHPDYVEGVSELVTLVPGGEAQVKVTLLQGASLEGRVLDERGLPVAGAGIELSSARASRSDVATSAADGTFAFAAVPSEVSLALSRPGARSEVVLKKQLHLEDGTRKQIELVLPAPRDAVRVLVVDGRDHPVEMAEVHVQSLDAGRALNVTRFSAADGSASIEDARGDQLRIRVLAPGFARTELTVASAAEELKVALQRGVIVEGRVTSVRGRRALANAQVSLFSGGVRKFASSDADGSYRMNDVAPGPAELGVTHPDFADEQLSVQVEPTARDDRAFELPDVDLVEPGSIEGEVLDEHGEPVAGARVGIGLAPEYFPVGALPRGVVLSDEQGQFVLGRVHPGSANVYAVSPISGRGVARGVAVSAGESARGVRIHLAAPAPADEPLARGGVAVTLGERGSGDALEVVVVRVAEGSEAERAGLAPGDVLRAVDGVRPSSMTDARSRFAGALGSDVVLELGREQSSLSVRVLREAVQR